MKNKKIQSKKKINFINLYIIKKYKAENKLKYFLTKNKN